MSTEAELAWIKGQVVAQGELLSALIGGVVDIEELKQALQTRTERGIAQLLGSTVADDVRGAYEDAMAGTIRALGSTNPKALQARIVVLEKQIQGTSRVAIEAGGALAAITSFIWGLLPAQSRERLEGEIKAAVDEAAANGRQAAEQIFRAALGFIEGMKNRDGE